MLAPLFSVYIWDKKDRALEWDPRVVDSPWLSRVKVVHGRGSILYCLTISLASALYWCLSDLLAAFSHYVLGTKLRFHFLFLLGPVLLCCA